jgi:hypothetical protein
MSEQVLIWLLGLIGALFCAGVLHILGSINRALDNLGKEVHTVGTNLTRLDRRVAYLEGRYEGGREPRHQPKGETECPTI